MSKRENKSKGKPSGRTNNTRRKSHEKVNAPIERKSTVKKAPNSDVIRLNKYVSNSGLCTRREADDYITSGRVYVNNKLVIKLGSKVSIDDEVKVDGKIIFPYDFQYLLLNKPIDFDFNISGKKNVLNLFSSLNALNLNPVQITVKQFSGLVLISNDNIIYI